MTDSALPSVPRHRQLPIAVILGAHEIAPAGQPVLAVFSLSEAVRSPVYVSAGGTNRPDGQISKNLSSPAAKNILVFRRPKSALYPPPSRPTEGRLAIVTNAGRDAVDADVPLTNGT
ncbi:hypothetical protein [Bradyrhizobium erythrophlei]|uniref:Uncharacterized protein n=1 Tax=Bradyrhizobium erythrophlei TaxID=1437360 RepID=A0A1M5LJ17_9BRAD|nr:hypothetical protein [Bradyrhizobium erythrophlei]SHG65018.1 hypothetical protein SAMN05444169_3498 [Bradyrhizobium erythrophlei]